MADSKRKARILIVDDEAAARAALDSLLVSEGYVVEAVEDGLAAIERAAEAPPDLVVTDLQMPRMDGMELLKRVRTQDRALPVIVVTSMQDLQSAVAAMRAGAEDYLTKPIDMDALLLAGANRLDRDAARIEAALKEASLPKWVADTRVETGTDPEGDLAAFVSIVVRSGEDKVLRDGDALSEVRRIVQDTLDRSDLDLWPYVRFVSEAEAA